MKDRKQRLVETKVKNLRHNPKMDVSSYIDQLKVEHFIKVFKNVGFWGCPARPVKGNPGLFEVPFGNHRLRALLDPRSGYGPDAIVTIIVFDDMTDDELLEWAAVENDEIYTPSLPWMLEMVRSTRNHLLKDTEEACTLIDKCAKPPDRQRVKNQLGKEIIGHELIARKLAWPESRVYQLLSVIRSMEQVDDKTKEPLVDSDAVNRLPNPKSALEFADTVKKTAQDDKNPTPIPKEEQRAVADHIKEDGVSASGIKDAFKDKSPTYLNHKRPKKPPKRKRLEGEVLRKKLIEDLGIVLFSTGKEKLTDTGWVTVHDGYLITVDDNIATLAPTDLKLSCAFRPSLEQTLQSCEDEWVQILFKGDYIDVVMDSGSSTVPAKPIEDVKYLTDIEGLPWKDLPHDFFRAVAECFSFRGESQLVSCYEEELLTLVTGKNVYTTDMHRAGMYTMKDPVEDMYLPYWLASTIKDMYKINQVPQGYVIQDGRIYFRLSNKGVIVTEIPVVDDSRFPKKQTQRVFSEFNKGEPVQLPPLKAILKDCESKYEKIKVATDRLIQLNFDGENITINTLELPKTEGVVNRKVECKTEGKYQFTVATSHLEQDTMYVGEDRILFQRGNFQQMVKTGGGYLITHDV